MRRLAAISLPLLLLTGCAPEQSTFNTHGPAAQRIANLSWLMTILFLVITFIMWVLIAWAVKRRRGTLAEHAPINIGGGQAWIAIGVSSYRSSFSRSFSCGASSCLRISRFTGLTAIR